MTFNACVRMLLVACCLIGAADASAAGGEGADDLKAKTKEVRTAVLRTGLESDRLGTSMAKLQEFGALLRRITADEPGRLEEVIVAAGRVAGAVEAAVIDLQAAADRAAAYEPARRPLLLQTARRLNAAGADFVEAAAPEDADAHDRYAAALRETFTELLVNEAQMASQGAP